MTRRTPAPCVCGAVYTALRTGMTFGEVRAMMWRADPPWRHRRRHSVLGYWRELKLSMWWSVHDGCAAEYRTSG